MAKSPPAIVGDLKNWKQTLAITFSIYNPQARVDYLMLTQLVSQSPLHAEGAPWAHYPTGNGDPS
jgi:hypothetical protein